MNVHPKIIFTLALVFMVTTHLNAASTSDNPEGDRLSATAYAGTGIAAAGGAGDAHFAAAAHAGAGGGGVAAGAGAAAVGGIGDESLPLHTALNKWQAACRNMSNLKGRIEIYPTMRERMPDLIKKVEEVQKCKQEFEMSMQASGRTEKFKDKYPEMASIIEEYDESCIVRELEAAQAVRLSCEEEISRLLQSGTVDFNARDEKKQTALDLAWGDDNMHQRIEEAHPDYKLHTTLRRLRKSIDARDNGEVLLQRAKMVELLKTKAVDSLDPHGHTPMVIAIALGLPDMIELLGQAGAKVSGDLTLNSIESEYHSRLKGVIRNTLCTGIITGPGRDIDEARNIIVSFVKAIAFSAVNQRNLEVGVNNLNNMQKMTIDDISSDPFLDEFEFRGRTSANVPTLTALERELPSIFNVTVILELGQKAWSRRAEAVMAWWTEWAY